MKLLKQKKKDLTTLIKILFICICFCQTCVFADDFFLSDLGISRFQKKSQITENADIITFEQVRGNQEFDSFFDKQIISVHKKFNDISPKEAGNAYLSRALFCDNTGEKYVVQNDDDNFEAVFCSKKLQKCEIVRFYNGFNGLAEIKYIHNNLWHFQNNIGSFLEFQKRIRSYPADFLYNKLYNTANVRL